MVFLKKPGDYLQGRQSRLKASRDKFIHEMVFLKKPGKPFLIH